MRHFKIYPFLGLSHFPPQGPEGARKKSLTGFKANGGDGRAEKSGRGHRFAREKSNDDDDTAGEGPGRGPQPAYPQSLSTPRPSPPPRMDPGVGRGRLPGGTAHLWPDLETGTLHTPPGLPGGDPGAAAAEPTLTYAPLRPRPPSPEAGPSLTVSPGSGLGALGEKRELTVGLRPAEGRCTRT